LNERRYSDEATFVFNYFAVVSEIDRREFNFFLLDIAPHIEFCPV